MPEKINKQCRDLYDEIMQIQKELNLSLSELCKSAYYVMPTDGTYSDKEDEEKERKYYEKYKKLFQREPWNNNKAGSRTLNTLTEFRYYIYLTDKYKETQASFLSPTIRKKMTRISKELEKKISYLN